MKDLGCSTAYHQLFHSCGNAARPATMARSRTVACVMIPTHAQTSSASEEDSVLPSSRGLRPHPPPRVDRRRSPLPRCSSAATIVRCHAQSPQCVRVRLGCRQALRPDAASQRELGGDQRQRTMAPSLSTPGDRVDNFCARPAHRARRHSDFRSATEFAWLLGSAGWLEPAQTGESVRLLVDQDVWTVAATTLQAAGHDVVRIADIGMPGPLMSRVSRRPRPSGAR